MYVISLITERDVVRGRTYEVIDENVGGYVILIRDDIGDEFGLYEHEYLVTEEVSYKEAYLEYHNKTEWVQETGTAKEWGKHRADILRERIEALQEENAELKFRLDSLEK